VNGEAAGAASRRTFLGTAAALPLLSVLPRRAGQRAAITRAGSSAAVTDWSKAVVDSTIHRFTPAKLGPWSYPEGLYLYGQYLVYKRLGTPSYLTYIQEWADRFVNSTGKLSSSLNSLDSMHSGNVLLVLYEATGDAKYKTAATTIRNRLNTYPRTPDGGFWHATSLKDQLWGDGTYMLLPFLIRYGQLFDDATYANDEVANQLQIYGTHLQDSTGLLFHAYDASGAASWANKTTHRSPEKWCRAMGWYGMAMTIALDHLPSSHPQRPALETILRNLVAGLAKAQDPKTGRWFQVVDMGSLAANWTETSSTAMYTYTITNAIRQGLISASYATVATNGQKGVMSDVSVGSDGLTNISQICVGTDVGDLAYYLARKRATNDLHGLGSFLLMNELLGSTAAAG
jgi:unsaturated rhamnogalacturonyl hydrolase